MEEKPSSETLVHENAFLQANIQQLQAQLNHYTASFQNLVSERDTLAQQYQNHCNQMKNHAHDLENHLQEEKEFRSSTETELKEKMAEIADLSLQLESIQEQSLMQEAKAQWAEVWHYLCRGIKSG